MGRFWGYAVSALVAVTGEVAVSVIANSITVPRKYYLAPFILFTALCLLMAAADLLQERGRRRNAPPPGPGRAAASGPRIVLRREWRDEPRLFVLYLLVMVFVGLNIAVFFGSHPYIHMTVGQHHAVEIASLGYTAVFGTMIVWLLVSRRPGIIMSAAEVLVFDHRGTRIVLSWSEVTDIFTESSRAGAWLLAVVPPSSPALYQSPTAKLYDAKRGVLKICDLRRIGLTQHQVDSALNAIHP
ncbi:hypothetical protein ABT052_28810 [Streptomyces sp. NPDC002766]|uniref:hypothetical protein n=1 Tax=Streptomyces sp. NPDC002766 TaxID=3154429 RepID=UPI00332790E8